MRECFDVLLFLPGLRCASSARRDAGPFNLVMSENRCHLLVEFDVVSVGALGESLRARWLYRRRFGWL